MGVLSQEDDSRVIQLLRFICERKLKPEGNQGNQECLEKESLQLNKNNKDVSSDFSRNTKTCKEEEESIENEEFKNKRQSMNEQPEEVKEEGMIIQKNCKGSHNQRFAMKIIIMTMMIASFIKKFSRRQTNRFSMNREESFRQLLVFGWHVNLEFIPGSL